MSVTVRLALPLFAICWTILAGSSHASACTGQAAQRRDHLRRRPGLRRFGLLWPSHDQHAPSRSHGGRGAAVHAVLRGRMRLHAQPGGAADRPAADSQRHVQRHAPRAVHQLDRRPAARGTSRSPRRSSRKTTPRPASANGTWATCPSFCRWRQGFDSYFGIPYSNDMKPTTLLRGEKVVEDPADQTTLTRRYTEEATRFIRDNSDGPFFLYFAHNFPHVPLFASDDFLGTSRRGLYGDVVEELDWSVGQVLDTLRELQIDRQHAGVLHQRQRPLADQESDTAVRPDCCAAAKAPPGKAACANRPSPGGPARFPPAARPASSPVRSTCWPPSRHLPAPKCHQIASSTRSISRCPARQRPQPAPGDALLPRPATHGHAPGPVESPLQNPSRLRAKRPRGPRPSPALPPRPRSVRAIRRRQGSPRSDLRDSRAGRTAQDRAGRAAIATRAIQSAKK